MDAEKDERPPGSIQPSVRTCQKCGRAIKWNGKQSGMTFWEDNKYQCYACVFGVEWE